MINPDVKKVVAISLTSISMLSSVVFANDVKDVVQNEVPRLLSGLEMDRITAGYYTAYEGRFSYTDIYDDQLYSTSEDRLTVRISNYSSTR
jgi:hypothetical protein